MSQERTPAIAETFALVVQLAHTRGARDLVHVPGLRREAVWNRYVAWINAHPEPQETETRATVAPRSIYVEHRGWPAGELNPVGGWFAAGSVVNEDDFLAELRAALRAAGEEPWSDDKIGPGRKP